MINEQLKIRGIREKKLAKILRTFLYFGYALRKRGANSYEHSDKRPNATTFDVLQQGVEVPLLKIHQKLM